MKSIVAVLALFVAAAVQAQVTTTDLVFRGHITAGNPIVISTPMAPVSDEDFINTIYYPATVLLYAQDAMGGLKMLCTATAIDKVGDDYTFATAAHCAASDDSDTHTASAEKKYFFISPDRHDEKEFTRANVIGCGYQHRGDDFCLFSVRTKENYPVVPLGVDASMGGEQIVNVASPLGLGKQVLYGRVSMPKLDRPVTQDDINWTDTTIVQLENTNGGSSGSAVVCLRQHAICGFLVGVIAGNTTIVVPVSRFKKFRELTAAKKYKWFVDEDDTRKKDE